MTTLKDKVAVVFAASGAIAGTIATSLAQYGAKVYISGRDIKAVKALADDIKHKGGWAEAAKVNAMNETEIDNYLQEIITKNSKIDIVFNGIGVRPSKNSYGIPATEIYGTSSCSLWFAIFNFENCSKVYDSLKKQGNNSYSYCQPIKIEIS